MHLVMVNMKTGLSGGEESPTELYNTVFILEVTLCHSNERHFRPKRGEPSEFRSLSSAKLFHDPSMRHTQDAVICETQVILSVQPTH